MGHPPFNTLIDPSNNHRPQKGHSHESKESPTSNAHITHTRRPLTTHHQSMQAQPRRGEKAHTHVVCRRWMHGYRTHPPATIAALSVTPSAQPQPCWPACLPPLSQCRSVGGAFVRPSIQPNECDLHAMQPVIRTDLTRAKRALMHVCVSGSSVWGVGAIAETEGSSSRKRALDASKGADRAHGHAMQCNARPAAVPPERG